MARRREAELPDYFIGPVRRPQVRCTGMLTGDEFLWDIDERLADNCRMVGMDQASRRPKAVFRAARLAIPAAPYHQRAFVALDDTEGAAAALALPRIAAAREGNQ